MNYPISFGNHKLPKTTAIFSMVGAYPDRCPSAKLGLCDHENICYARRMEIRYHNVLTPYRKRQTELWDSTTAEQFANIIIDINSRKRIKITSLRISDSGDFRNQADFDKCNEVAKILAKHGIRVYTYTCRSDLDFSKRCDNFTVNGSGFMVDNNFYIIPRKSKKKIGLICPMDCRKCTMCMNKKNSKIAIRQH